MSGDDKLCTTCLTGLIKTGRKLRIDVIDYEKELEKRKKKSSTKKSATKKASQPKKITQKKATPKKVKSSIASQNRLKSIRWKDKQRLVLKFSRPIRQNELNSFALNYPEKNQYKKIYDIYAVLSQKAMQLKHSSVKKIRLAQFDQKTLRIVFESDAKIKQQYKLDGDELTIKMSSAEQGLSYIPVTGKPSRKVIVIDPGHGGKDAGAVGYKKYREKVVVLQLSRKLRDILVKRGYTAIDVASGGRLDIGLGAGWAENEHAAYGIDLPALRERFDRLEEACAVIDTLLTNEWSDFRGQHYQLTNARCEPKPIQRPRPPLLIGGKGQKRTLRIVAEWADEWNFPGGEPKELRHLIGVLHGHCADIGRDPNEIGISVKAEATIEPAAFAELVASYRDAGAEHIIAHFPAPHDPADLGRYAEALTPVVS